MYLPPHFDARDPALATALMREHPFASLISVDPEGLPFVTHLPMHLEERAGENGPQRVLHAHCARANPHWKLLAQRPQAVVTFLGPHAYQSPRIYAEKDKVPSWNYVAVHCTVQARLLEGSAAKDALLKLLIADHEPAFAQQWREFDPAFAEQMLGGIVAFELDVVSLQCKIKLNQHRPQSHAALKAGYAAGNADEQALAGWMDRLGIGGQ